jgi:hypothetical protein
MSEHKAVYATMYPLGQPTFGTLTSEEAERHWDEKKQREDAAAAEADRLAAEHAVQAKVVKAPQRKTPRMTEGAQGKGV